MLELAVICYIIGSVIKIVSLKKELSIANSARTACMMDLYIAWDNERELENESVFYDKQNDTIVTFDNLINIGKQ